MAEGTIHDQNYSTPTLASMRYFSYMKKKKILPRVKIHFSCPNSVSWVFGRETDGHPNER